VGKDAERQAKVTCDILLVASTALLWKPLLLSSVTCVHSKLHFDVETSEVTCCTQGTWTCCALGSDVRAVGIHGFFGEHCQPCWEIEDIPRTRNDVPSGWEMREDPRIAVILLPGVTREADEQRNVPQYQRSYSPMRFICIGGDRHRTSPRTLEV
jgi:hypothetical protein